MNTIKIEKEQKNKKNKTLVIRVLIGLLLSSILFPMLFIVGLIQNVWARSIGFVLFFLITIASSYEFSKVINLSKWATYYLPCITFLVFFSPLTTMNLFFNDGIHLFKGNILVGQAIGQILKEQFIFRVGLPGMGYLIFAIYILIPFIFKKNKSLYDLKIYLISIITFIFINFSGKLLFIMTISDFWFTLLIICAVVVADTFAYFGGRMFGNKLFKRKLAPKISPNKTIEGAIVGYIFSFLLLIICLNVVDLDSFKSLSSYWYVYKIILPIVFPVVAIIGDLSFSFTKRILKIKDFRNLLPEHGGMLDRFDSIISCSFIFFPIFLLALI